MYCVKLEWASECYRTFWVRYFKLKKNADALYRSTLEKEYKSLFDVEPDEDLDDSDMYDEIQEAISEKSDYYFDLEVDTVKPEDEK